MITILQRGFSYILTSRSPGPRQELSNPELHSRFTPGRGPSVVFAESLGCAPRLLLFWRVLNSGFCLLSTTRPLKTSVVPLLGFYRLHYVSLL